MNYSEALKGDAPLIMGLVLRPLSLGAIVTLFNEKCAVMDVRRPLLDSKNPYVNIARVQWASKELRKALLICAMTFEDYNALKRDGKEMAKVMREWDAVILKLRWAGKLDLIDSINLFNEYLNEAFTFMPKFTYANKPQFGDEPDKENWYHDYLLELGESRNMSESEVLNRPYVLTKMDYYGLGAKKGAVNMKSNKEQDLLKLNMSQFTPDGGIKPNEDFEAGLLRMNAELMKNYGQ